MFDKIVLDKTVIYKFEKFQIFIGKYTVKRVSFMGSIFYKFYDFSEFPKLNTRKM